MPLSMYGASVPLFTRTLNALSAVLDKADAYCAAKKVEPSVLLNTRLYPDMLPLTRQVQLTCDFAKNCVGRLSGEPPKFPDEEKTIEELKARIAKTLDFVNSVKPQQIDGTEEKDITFPLGPENKMTMKGEAYLVTFALPNFYFHATTAYDILRHCGVELGKRDFLGWR
jgi:hypothetical protein